MKKRFLMHGISLTLIALVIKSSNIFYRAYLTSEMGADGMGLYQLIFSVFVLAITLSTSGISLAVTMLVSSLITKGRQSQIRSLVTKCLLFCLTLSISISCIFYFCSDFIATNFLGNYAASNSLKILGLGLPFMSLCTCMKGYFLAVDECVSSSIADLCEQIVTIGATVLIFIFIPFENIEKACVVVMCASTLGEMISFVIDFIALRISFKKNTPKLIESSTGVLHGLTHIALPCTLSSAIRSALVAVENLLIPYQLQMAGATYTVAMTQYGLLSGMALPMLYFPAAFVSSFAMLLIPKLCMEKELNNRITLASITNRSLSTVLAFGIITGGFFFVFSGEMALVFYGDISSSSFIKIFAPLVPVMYLDIVLDSLLKGLDEQLNSMKYNIIDSSIRVLLILFLMREFGLQSYIYILFFSVIFNATLSLSKVIVVARTGFTFFKPLFYQVPAMLISLYTAKNVPNLENELHNLILMLVISFSMYIILIQMIEKLFINGIFRKNNEPVISLRSVLF